MNAKDKIILSKIQKINENVLTKEFIIPLLEKLGYFKIEFFGGFNEEGKDILMWDKDRLGNIKLNVTQVKHFKLTNVASSSKSLQTIVNQISVCFNKSITYLDQIEYFPEEAWIISTFQIDAKTLKSYFGHYPNLLHKKIKIIDGNQLVELFIKYIPEKISAIIGINIDYKDEIFSTLNNKVLLNALGFKKEKQIKTIYTDINFSVGKLTSKIFFSAEFNPISENFELSEDEWASFSKILDSIQEDFPDSFLEKNRYEILTTYNKERENFKVWTIENDLWKRKINELEGLITIDESNLEKVLSAKLFTKKNIFNEDEIKVYKQLIEAKKKKKVILKNELKTLLNKNEKLLKKHLLKKPDLKYKVSVSGEKLASLVINRREWIELMVQEFNKNNNNTSINHLRNFILSTNKILNSGDIILTNQNLLKSLGIIKNFQFRKTYETTRLKIPINRIFDTGISMTVLGEAGAGKTTSLQMYAIEKQNEDKLVLWIPLSRISNYIKDVEKDSVREQLEKGIIGYLQSLEIKINSETLKDSFLNNNSILLLDGIDEAIKLIPWLPKAIEELESYYNPKLQIIVSSRLTGTYVDQLPFFTITLLPFTVEQRNQFIKKWFEDGNNNVVKIVEHLENNKQLSEVVNNPLLTTTLCIIAENNLPLPNSEIKLYNDRIKLLTGYYDSAKNISRIYSTQYGLEEMSQKIAFHLNLIGKREKTLSDLKVIAIELMSSSMNFNDAEKAFFELIDPCNILVPMTEDGEYGFGHLRFQEHLAAKEIKSNRSIDILQLLPQPWWRDTLLLFAQMNEKIDWLINDLKAYAEISKSKDILIQMIKLSRDDDKEKVIHELNKITNIELKLNVIGENLELNKKNNEFETLEEFLDASDLFYFETEDN